MFDIDRPSTISCVVISAMLMILADCRPAFAAERKNIEVMALVLRLRWTREKRFYINFSCHPPTITFGVTNVFRKSSLMLQSHNKGDAHLSFPLSSSSSPLLSPFPLDFYKPCCGIEAKHCYLAAPTAEY